MNLNLAANSSNVVKLPTGRLPTHIAASPYRLFWFVVLIISNRESLIDEEPQVMLRVSLPIKLLEFGDLIPMGKIDIQAMAHGFY